MTEKKDGTVLEGGCSADVESGGGEGKNEQEKLFRKDWALGVRCGHALRDVIGGMVDKKGIGFMFGLITTLGPFVESVVDRCFELCVNPEAARAEYREAVAKYMAAESKLDVISDEDLVEI